MTNVLDSGRIVSEFELHSCYYIPFGTNTLVKGTDTLIPPTQLWVK